MSTLAVAPALSLAAAVAPHRIPLHRATPTTGATVWMLSLMLRALIVVGVATFAFGRLAHSTPIEGTLNWCWHVVLPDLPHRLGFAEHPVAHAVVAVPLFAIAAALLANACGGLRSWRQLRRRLSGARSWGPLGAALLPDDDVVVAVTRFGRGRVVLSDRASS